MDFGMFAVLTQDGITNVRATPVYLDDKYGIPSIVTGEHATSILERLEQISEGMSSAFEIRDDVAYVTPDQNDQGVQTAQAGQTAETEQAEQTGQAEQTEQTGQAEQNLQAGQSTQTTQGEQA